MFKWRKPDVPEEQIAKFKPEPQISVPVAVPPPPPKAAPLPSAPLKEAPSMSSTSSNNNPAATRPHFNPPPAPTNNAPAPSVRTSLRPEANEKRVLVIGKGISISGTINDAERLVIEGHLDSQLVRANEISISPSGVFVGEAEDAEISGSAEGTITARGSLIVRAPGRITGTARCRRLQVEDGGQITGKVEMITDSAPVAPAPAAAPAPEPVFDDQPSALPVKPDLIG